jgi:hypothetical protein
MPPKKKEEEPPPAEELLPSGYAIGCEVHWVTFTTPMESGVEVKPGMKGTLEAVGDLISEVGADDVKRWFIDKVTVKFEEFDEPLNVSFGSLSLEPPPLDILDCLTTGLKLPLRGIDVGKIWDLDEKRFDKQSEMITKMLGLKERYAVGRIDIVCDFHLYNLIHAKSLCLNSVQGAVFLGIMDHMLRKMTSASPTADMQPSDMCTSEICFKEFQHIMLSHARQEPPDRLGIFRDSEVRLLTDFAAVTLFKHYLLYQYCMNFDREVETLRFNPQLERPSAPPDLKLANAPDPKRRQVPENTLHTERDLSSEAPINFEEQAEPSEEEKVAQLVQEKLEEVKNKLHERLAQREAEFMQRLEEEKPSGGKK